MSQFATLVADLDPDIALTGSRSFELLLDGRRIPCRTTLAPGDRWIVADFYIRDVGDLTGGARRALDHAILALNGLSPFESDSSISIDTRGYLVLTGRRPMAGMTGAKLGEALARWLEAARELADMAGPVSGRVQAVSLGAPEPADTETQGERP